jgi:signal transduction histidine kinase
LSLGLKFSPADLSRRQINLVVGLAAMGLVAVLVLFGLQLHDSQATSRHRVVTRFRDRAELISALTQAVFSSVAATPATVRQYDSPVVSDSSLDRAAGAGHLVYMALTDRRGKVIAASRGLTPAARAAMLSPSGALRAAVHGAPVSLSDVLSDGPGGANVIQYAVTLDTRVGRRVLLAATRLGPVSAFLGSYLTRVPSRTGFAAVLDSRGNVVGARDPRLVAGRPLATPALFAAVQSRNGGSYGRDGYFSAVPVAQSHWRVVLTQSKSNLFYSVTGARERNPWLVFATLGLVAAGFLVLLWRLLANGSKLARANRQLASNNAKLESVNSLLRHASELTRSNQELEQFASIASHDLQEPLRKVQTFAAQLDVMERDQLSEEGRDYLRRMGGAAGRMRTLIDDLLMFSRVSTQGRPFVDVPLDRILAQVLEDLELAIHEAGAHITVDDLPVIAGDGLQLRQLMLNLLGNALKFARPGTVPEVSVRAEVIDGVAELAIRDNGIGFDSQYAARIFRPFERLHGVVDYPGTGIGLALCRKIVDRHHGTITAESAIGQGSVFTVRLPVEQPIDGDDPGEALASMHFEEAASLNV